MGGMERVSRRRLRDLLFIIHHRLVLMCGLRGLGVVHGTHGHRERTLPPSRGTRFLLPVDVNNSEGDESQENEDIEPHHTKHDWNEGIESVQGDL